MPLGSALQNFGLKGCTVTAATTKHAILTRSFSVCFGYSLLSQILVEGTVHLLNHDQFSCKNEVPIKSTGVMRVSSSKIDSYQHKIM